MKQKILSSCLVLSGLLPGLAMALGAHEHGVAELDVGIEGKTLELSLHSPMANLVGFEHAPHHQEQLDSLKQMVATLEQGEQVFVLDPAAGCRQEAAEVVLPYELALDKETAEMHHGEEGHASSHDDHHHEDDKHDHGEHHDEDKHAHDDHHDEDKHAHDDHHDEDKHAHDDHHDHDHGDEHDDVHADVDADWRFTCAEPGKLNVIETRLFEQYSGMESIKVQVISDAGQQGQVLTPADTTIRLP